MSEAALERAMERLKSGDASAFDYIYDRTVKAVFFAVYSVLNDKDAADDVVQDTYAAAYRGRMSYNSDNLLSWLMTIGKRLAINEYNRRKRTVPTDFSAEGERFGGQEGLPDEDSFGLISLARKVLSEEDFTIVTMCAVSGYKRREAASVLGLPISTVSHRLKVSLKKLGEIANLKGGSNELD